MSDLRIRVASSADAGRVPAFWTYAAEGTSISDDADGVARLITRDPEVFRRYCCRPSGTASWSAR